MPLSGSKEVLYAGDVHSAKEDVSNLIRSLGFTPVDRGALRNAREIEDIPVQRFPLWKRPLMVSLILFAVYFILGFTKYQVCWTYTWDAGYDWANWYVLGYFEKKKNLDLIFFLIGIGVDLKLFLLLQSIQHWLFMP